MCTFKQPEQLVWSRLVWVATAASTTVDLFQLFATALCFSATSAKLSTHTQNEWEDWHFCMIHFEWSLKNAWKMYLSYVISYNEHECVMSYICMLRLERHGHLRFNQRTPLSYLLGNVRSNFWDMFLWMDLMDLRDHVFSQIQMPRKVTSFMECMQCLLLQ